MLHEKIVLFTILLLSVSHFSHIVYPCSISEKKYTEKLKYIDTNLDGIEYTELEK